MHTHTNARVTPWGVGAGPTPLALTPTSTQPSPTTTNQNSTKRPNQGRAQPELTFLSDVSLEVASASLTVVIGATGAGKSGLLLSLIGAWSAWLGAPFLPFPSIHSPPTHPSTHPPNKTAGNEPTQSP